MSDLKFPRGRTGLLNDETRFGLAAHEILIAGPVAPSDEFVDRLREDRVLSLIETVLSGASFHKPTSRDPAQGR